MKKIAILGSTGSIGKSTLEIVAARPEQFEVVGLSAATNIDVLEVQIQQFHPKAVAVLNKAKAQELRTRLSSKSTEVLEGMEGIEQIATLSEVETVVSGIVGAAGLLPALAALSANKNVALANKEVLVMGGALVRKLLNEKEGKLLPVDSEHAALFQALGNRPISEVRKMLLTASGGPFLKTPVDDLERVTPQQAINHPRWKMGPKISVDSATMMNKGLEVIEARWLFDVLPNQIEIVVHPESLVHSMVEFVDGSILAQLGVTDMKIPIQSALTYPELKEGCAGYLDLAEVGQLNFEKPDMIKFPILKLAFLAAEQGGTTPCVLNAANEVAVEAFLKEQIAFLDIIKVIEHALKEHSNKESYSLEEILNLDQEIRIKSNEFIETLALVSR